MTKEWAFYAVFYYYRAEVKGLEVLLEGDSICNGFLQRLTSGFGSRSFSQRRFLDAVVGGVSGKWYDDVNDVDADINASFFTGVDDADGSWFSS
jgi:hypothetical protein